MKKVFILMILFAQSLFGQIFYQYENLKFENGFVDEVPANWKYSRQQKEAGKIVALDVDNAFEGKMCLRMSNPLELLGNDLSLTSQSVEAYPYRNKKVRFQAAVKMNYLTPKANAELWIQVKSKKDTVDAEIRMYERPIKAAYWQYYSVEMYVPVDCVELKFGFILNGPGTAYVDDASLEVIQPYYINLENTKDINDDKINTILTYAKAYGLIRFFYPGTENFEADWTRILINSIEFIDRNDVELPEMLTRTLQPFSYLAKFSTKKIENRESSHHKDALPYQFYSWYHKGGFTLRNTGIYNSELYDTYKSYLPREAVVMQSVNTINLKNKKVTFSASIKTDLFNPGSQAQLWMRGDDGDRQLAVANATFNKPSRNKDWQRYEVSLTIPDTVQNLRLGLILIGTGKAWFDDVKLIAEATNGKIEEIPLKNSSFEEQNADEEISRGWLLPDYVPTSGYLCRISDKQFSKDKQSLEIASDENYTMNFPQFGEFYDLELTENLWASIPLSLEGDSIGTLPRSSRSFRDLSARPRQFQPVVEDRNSRIAQLVDEFAHLYYFAVRNNNDREKLCSIFRECIKKTSNFTSNYYANQFGLMRELLTITKDAQSRLWHNDIRKEYVTPIQFKKIADKVIITKVIENSEDIQPGDEIIQINGEEIKPYLDRYIQNIPGLNNVLKSNIALSEIRSGKIGEKVDYTVQTKDGKLKSLILEKNLRAELLTDDKPRSFSFIGNGTMYIDLTSCTDAVLWEFLQKFKSNANFIFDLRGLCQVSEHFLGYFIKTKMQTVNWQIPIYTKPIDITSSYQKIIGIIEKYGNLENSKMVFLCDERSVGYSEAILKISRVLNLGKIIGERTAGMPGDALAVRLIGGFNMSYTPSWDYPNSIQYNGLIPDIIVKQDVELIKQGIDPVIERALELLNN